jgi:hypothetical protein
MSHRKTITAVYQATIRTATIAPGTPGGQIYDMFRSAYRNEIGSFLNIIIYDPTRNRKAHLDYHSLKEGTTYLIETTPEPRQAAVKSSSSTTKTRIDIEKIFQDWGLGDASEILPADIAPSQDPFSWSRPITAALRSLSGRSKVRRDAAIWYLAKEVEERCEWSEKQRFQVTAGDAKKALNKMVMGMAQEAGAIIQDG